MLASFRSVVLMVLGPPTVLLSWAHFLRSELVTSEWPALIFAVMLGLVGVLTAPWRSEVKAALAVGYLLLAIPALPFIGLLAVCSTGDCL